MPQITHRQNMPEHARTYCSQKILNMFCHIWHLIEHLLNWHQPIKHSSKILRLVHRCSHKPPFHRIFPITPLSSQMFPYICQYLSCVPILIPHYEPDFPWFFRIFDGFSMTFPSFQWPFPVTSLAHRGRGLWVQAMARSFQVGPRSVSI